MTEIHDPGHKNNSPELGTDSKNEITPIPGAEPTHKSRKLLDFCLGFFGGIIGNAILVVMTILIRFFLGYINIPALWSINLFVWLAIPWVVNIGVIIFLLVKRRKNIVFGLLAAFALGLLFTACLVATCFSMEGYL